jgi:hypothetical protein
VNWAKAALAGGLLVLFATFAIGTESELSTSVMGRTRNCGPSISASWLVSGTPDLTHPGSLTTSDERRVAAACTAVVHESRVLVVVVMCAGGLLALVGWTALGTRGEAAPRRVTSAA